MRYKIADLITEYEPLTEEFAAFLAPFSCDGEGEPDISLRYSREKAEELLGRMAQGTTLAQLILDGKAYLFSADSGVGKSTHTRLWLQAFGDRVHIMNDDKPVVRIADDGIFACGTPFDGGSGIALNETFPLGAIIFIERGEENAVRVPSEKEIIQRLYFQTARFVGPQTADMMLGNFDSLIGRAKFLILTCNTDISAARVAYRAVKDSEQ